ncbi:DUF2268 domain-containing protein [Microbacteriaceae bacterium 4G12]
MGIMETDEWLLMHYDNPVKLCQQFVDYIPLSPSQIYTFLVSRGMYRPVRNGIDEVKKLQEKRIWEQLRLEYKGLRRWLKGPNIPVFILPSDTYNQRIQKEYGGKTGLAFRECLFLFVSTQNTIQELKAVLTHEYHHICRLHALNKKEEDCTLLDTMILEGLAEAAVAERHSQAEHAAWVQYYTKKQALALWDRFLKDSCHIKRGTKQHDALLNGLRGYPSMLGYCVGFYIVKDCLEHTKKGSIALLTLRSEEILHLAPSFS